MKFIKFMYSLFISLLWFSLPITVQILLSIPRLSSSFTFVLYAIISFFIILIGFKLTGKSMFIECDFRKPKEKNIAFAIYIGASLSIFTAVFIQIVKIIPEEWLKKNQEHTSSLNDGLIIFTLLSVMVLAPIIEEIIYRGLIFKAISKASNPTIGIIISAIFFGVAHMNMLQGLYAFTIGLVLAFTFYKSKSIWISIIIHSAYNSANIFASPFMPKRLTEGIVVLAITLGIAITMLIAFYRNNKDENNSIFSGKIILASASPRRADILNNLGIKFTVLSSDAESDSGAIEGNCVEIAKELSKRKALDVFIKYPVKCEDSIIIGADTIVTMDPDDSKYIGKPVNEEDAVQILRLLSGKMHYVITALTLYNTNTSSIDTRHETTTVYFDELTDDEIYFYIRTGQPMDKAGAYGIQTMASMFINKIDGDYFNVVGLPTNLLYKMLKNVKIQESLHQEGQQGL